MTENADLSNGAITDTELYEELAKAGLPTSIPRYRRGGPAAANVVPYLISVILFLLTVIAYLSLHK